MEFVCPNCSRTNEINNLHATGGHYAVDCPYCCHGYTIDINIQALAGNKEPALSKIPLEEQQAKIADEARLAAIETHHAPESSRTLQRVIASFASILLIALLGLQQAYFRRDALAHDERLRPWLVEMCGLAGCRIPPRHDPDKFEISNPDVRLAPGFQNVLIASVMVRNTSRFPQSLPDISLRFHDIQHGLVAARTFTPVDYGFSPDKAMSLIEPEQSIRATVKIIDPGKDALGFEFSVI